MGTQWVKIGNFDSVYKIQHILLAYILGTAQLPSTEMISVTHHNLKATLERTGWPTRAFRSHSAALRFAIGYFEQQQANGVSRASLHQEFVDLGFDCNFNTFAVALKRAKAKARSVRGEQVATNNPHAEWVKLSTIQTGSAHPVDGGIAHATAERPTKGEIAGFVSSTKNNSEKLREELI